MRNRRRHLTLCLLASAIALGRVAYPAELSQSGLVEHAVITEVAPAEADSWPMTIPALPAEFAMCHQPGVPAWYFQMEGLALKRDASGDQTFQAFVERVWERQTNPDYIPTSATDPTPVDPNEPKYVWETTGDLTRKRR